MARSHTLRSSRPGPSRYSHRAASRSDSISPLTSPTHFQQALDDVSPMSDRFVVGEDSDSEEDSPKPYQAYKLYRPSKGKGRMTDDDDAEVPLQPLPSGTRNLTPAVKLPRRGAVRQVRHQAAPQHLLQAQTAEVVNIPEQAQIVNIPATAAAAPAAAAAHAHAPQRNSSQRQFNRGRQQQLMLSAIHGAEDMIHVPVEPQRHQMKKTSLRDPSRSTRQARSSPSRDTSPHPVLPTENPGFAPCDDSWRMANVMERGAADRHRASAVRNANRTAERRANPSTSGRGSFCRSRCCWIIVTVVVIILVILVAVGFGQVSKLNEVIKELKGAS